MLDPQTVKEEFVWKEPDSLRTLVERIHDQVVDLDEVRVDLIHGQVVLPLSAEGIAEQKICSFLGFAVYDYLTFAAHLIISHVERFEVIDEEEIGVVDLNTVEFDKPTLTIKGGVPITLRFQVSTLLVQLLVFDKVVSRHRFIGLDR